MRYKSVFPGSFDPFTLAHKELVSNASKFFDVVILIAVNPDKGKGMFTLDQRKDIIETCIKNNKWKNIRVDVTDGLIYEYCIDHDIEYVLRGIQYKNAASEIDLAHVYFEDGSIKTVFFPTYKQEYERISSTRVREYIKRGDSLWTNHVPPETRCYIRDILKQKSKNTK